jgi:hypothetical protein
MVEYARKGAQYHAGELEVILSLAPTDTNIANLALLLDRSENAVRLVYRIAHGKLVSCLRKTLVQRMANRYAPRHAQTPT